MLAGHDDQPSSKRPRLKESHTHGAEDGQQGVDWLPSSTTAPAAQVLLPPGAMQSLLVQREPLPSLERLADVLVVTTAMTYDP